LSENLGSKQQAVNELLHFFTGLTASFQQHVESLEEEIYHLKKQNAALRRDAEYRTMFFDSCMCYY
jgi:hypothetical protein